MGEPRRYRKKPVEVTALQYTGPDGHRNVGDDTQRGSSVIEAFMGPAYNIRHDSSLAFWIEKSQAVGTIRPGDWIIAEPDGSGFYPCSKADFEATYEAIPPLYLHSHRLAGAEFSHTHPKGEIAHSHQDWRYGRIIGEVGGD